MTRLRPSSAERWIACPGSVLLSADIEDEGSIWAQEGTHAHALAALRAQVEFGLLDAADAEMEYVGWEAEALDAGYDIGEMEDHVEAYVAFLKGLMENDPDAFVWIETRVNAGIGDIEGTADALVVSRKNVHVVDLKYGRGVAVDVQGNPQLRLYGLGALEAVFSLGTIETVSMTVFQPRIGSVRTETITVKEILTWAMDVVVPAIKATEDPDPVFNPGPVQCRWCPAGGFCKPRADLMLTRERTIEAATLKPEDLAEAVAELEDVRSWCDAVQAEAFARADRGAMPGYKIVRAAGRRSITDDAKAIEVLVAAGFDEDAISRKQTQTLGVLERVVGKKNLPDVLGDLLMMKPGNKSLAPEDDPRPAVTSAMEDFM